MKINKISSFAAGIFVTTSIIGSVYFLTADNNTSNKQEKTTKPEEQTETIQLSETEMKTELEALGYVVQTKEENDKEIEAAKQETAQQTENNTNQNEPTEAVTRVVVNVSDGMTSIDVGRVLEESKLIENSAFNFSKDIESRGVENKLRPGTYIVDSSMSYDEIISTIFK